nr:5782_t:CDS:2 [Entrophospora candida]
MQSKSLKNRIRQAEPVLQLDELEHVREQELLNGVFNDLSAEPIAAPLYCFVIDEKVEEMDIKLQEVLNTPYSRALEATRITECSISKNILNLLSVMRAAENSQKIKYA